MKGFDCIKASSQGKSSNSREGRIKGKKILQNKNRRFKIF